MKRTSMILIGLAFNTACGGEETVSPVVPELTAFIVRPAAVALLPGITTELSLLAWDELQRPVTPGTEAALSYVSSDPAIVTVSQRGAVTGVSPGTATIGITITRGKVTLSRSVNVQVKELRPGSLKLTAPVSESGWGNEGRTFKALLSLDAGSRLTGAAPAGAIGTFTNLVLMNADGSVADSAPEGWVTSQLDARGNWLIGLVVSQDVRWEGRVEFSGEHELAGSYQIGDGWAAGSFTAKRDGNRGAD